MIGGTRSRLALASASVLAVFLVPLSAHAQEARNQERAFLARMISYSRNGRTAGELVNRAIEFDPAVAAATRATMNRMAAASELEKERAAEVLRLARLETSRRVLLAWAEAIAARRQLLTLQNLSAGDEKILAAVKALPEGRASDELMRELEIERRRVRSAVVLADAAFNTSSSRLAALLNASIAAPVAVNTTFELIALKRIPSDVEALVVEGSEAHPDLRIARLDERIAQAELLRPFTEPAREVGAGLLTMSKRGGDAMRPDLAEAGYRRRYLERMNRSDVESAFANFISSQQARNELELILATLRQNYGGGELDENQIVMQQRQRFDLEMQMEHITAALMRAGVELITAMGMEP